MADFNTTWTIYKSARVLHQAGVSWFWGKGTHVPGENLILWFNDAAALPGDFRVVGYLDHRGKGTPVPGGGRTQVTAEAQPFTLPHKKRVPHIAAEDSRRRRRPTLPPSGSTIGADGLNFPVRNGKGWTPSPWPPEF